MSLRESIQHVPLVLACILLTLLALSPVITASDRTLVEYHPAWWGPLSVFRSSGRMFWPVFYLLIALVLRAVMQLPQNVAAPLMVVAVVLQGADISALYKRARGDRDFGFRQVLDDRFWNTVLPQYDVLALVPSNLCARVALDPTEFLLVAGRHGVSVNAGLAARFDSLEAQDYCRALDTELREGLRSNTLYVAASPFRRALGAALDATAICAPVDGFEVCTAAAAYSRWQNHYDLARASLPPAAELLDAYNVIDVEYRDRLQRQPHDAPGTRQQRLEALATYLGYRSFGCDHDEAARMTLRRLAADGVLRVCASFGPGRALSTPADTFEFRRRLDDTLAEGAPEATHVDPEGEAVWIHRYVEHRLRGLHHAGALEEVLRQLRQVAP